MDVDTQQANEHSESLQSPTEEDHSDSKSRGRGVKGRNRGGRIGRGGRGGRGMMMKGYGPLGRGRGRGRDGAMNGFGPGRRGMGRMRPYPDLRGRRGIRGGPMGMGPPPPPPPPMHMQGPYPPMHSLPPHPHQGIQPSGGAVEGCTRAHPVTSIPEASTMDPPLSRLPRCLAEASAGRRPLVAGTFKAAYC
ncbi:hypothetical protein JZ751_013388 [Albula glossodonta]|uniref:Uncharacterized protein n=1 Tax=Albula glossodonta TaxID=121402 RepID=A0A8T2MLS6_9TELE|nr:hypothetical protein JZ751_013388 [Albula glossodonta]